MQAATPAADHSKRVLWLTEEPPDRGLGGGSIRQAHLFSALAGAFDVDLVLVGQLGDERVRRAAASVTELPRRRPPWSDRAIVRRALQLAIALGSPYPAPSYPAAPARRALERVLERRRQDYSLVCVEHEALAPLGRRLDATPSIITFHHLVSEMIGQELGHTSGTRQRWLLRQDLRKARRVERRAVARFDRIVTCSESDAAILRDLGGHLEAHPVSVIPNGVDLAAFPVTPVPSTPQVLFPGSLAYAPNVDGALWFCREVWPQVRAKVPAAELVLAGRDPVAEVVDLSRGPGVTVCANVPSMVDYFVRARTVVVPLRVGTGTRLKALEAMAACRPMVGTTVGLDGIGLEDGVHGRIADQPAQMAQAIVETLRSDELAQSLGQAARDHVERHFGWDRIGADFVALAEELMAGGRSPLASAAS